MSLFEIKSFDIHQSSLFAKDEGSGKLNKLHPDLRKEYDGLKQKKNKGELHPAGHTKLGHYDKYLSGHYSHDELASKVMSKEKPEPSQRSKELAIGRKRKEMAGMVSGPDVVVKDERVQSGLKFDIKPQSSTIKKLSDPSQKPTHKPTGMPIIDLSGDKLKESLQEKHGKYLTFDKLKEYGKKTETKPDTPYLKKLKKTSGLKVEHQKEVSRLAKRPEHMKTPREELTEGAYARHSTGDLSVSGLKTELVKLKSSTLRGKGEKKETKLRSLGDPAWSKPKKEDLTSKQKIDKKYDLELAQLPQSMKGRHTQMSEPNKKEHRDLFHKDETTGLNDKEEMRLEHIHSHLRGEIDHNELDKRLGKKESGLKTWFTKDKKQKASTGRIISHGKYTKPEGAEESWGYKLKKYGKAIKQWGKSLPSDLESQRAEHKHIPHVSDGYKLNNANSENTGVMHFGEGHGPINMVMPKGDHYIFHSQREEHDKDTRAKYLDKVQKHFKLSSPEAADKFAKDVIGKYHEFGKTFKDKVANNPQGITVNVFKHKDFKIGNTGETIGSHYIKPKGQQELFQKGFKQTGLGPDEERKYNERWDKLSDKHKNHYLTLMDKNNKSLVLKPNHKDLPEGESKFKSKLTGEHKEHFGHYHNYLSGKTTHDELMGKISPSQASLFDKVGKEPPQSKGMLKPLGRVKNKEEVGTAQVRMFKSQAGMFDKPKTPSDMPVIDLSEKAGKPEGMVKVKEKKFDKDVTIDKGKYKYGGNQKDFERALYDYGSHSNFMGNAKPEHQDLRDKIKELHPAESIREHFIKTTGRWQDQKDRPGHLIPSERTTLTKHQDTGNYWKSNFLNEDEKKTIDKYTGGKDFHNAAEKGELSPDLLKKLKDWNANHYNVGRERVFHKEGKFIKGQGGDKSPLENWYHHPTGSNKELETDVPDIDDSIQESMFSKESQGWKKGGPSGKSSTSIASLKTPERMKGEEVEYAGQKHKILNKVTEGGKTKGYNITGEDDITREVGKEALEHEKRKKFESKAGQIHGKDIHSNNFQNTLRGRKKDIYDEPFGTQLPKEMKEQLVDKYGFSTDEAIKIHQHINSSNIKQGKGEKGKEFMQSQNVSMSSDDQYKREMLKRVDDYREGAKDSAKEEEQAGKRKSEYENIINKHKERLEGEHFHPNKNEGYVDNKKEHHKLHTINQAGLDHYMQKLKSADKEFNETEFLNGIGIEANTWTLDKAKEVMKKSGRLKYRESGQNLRAKIRETYNEAKKSIAHSIDYIKGKLKKMGKRKEEPKPTLKGLAPYKLWELKRSLEAEAEDYMGLVLDIIMNDNKGVFEWYNQLMLKKSIQYALTTTQEYLNMDEVGYEEYQKSIPQSLYTLHEDGTFSEQIINPFEN